MKVTEKQLLIMFRTLEGSLTISDRTDMNLFGYDNATRRMVFSQIINQQSDAIVEVTQPEKPVEPKNDIRNEYDARLDR